MKPTGEGRELRKGTQATRGQIIRFLTLLVVLGLAVHIILPQLASLEHSYQVIKGMAAWAVGLAILAQALSYVGNGYLLAAIVRLRSGRLSVFWGTVITLASGSLGLVIGGTLGSTTSTYYWIREKGGDSQGALLASTLPFLFNNGVLLVVAIIGLIRLLVIHDLTTLQVVSFLLFLLLLLGIIGLSGWGIRHPERSVAIARQATAWIARRLHRSYDPSRVGEYLMDLIQSWETIQSGGWQRPAWGAVMNVGFDMLTLYALFFAAGHPISPAVLLTGYGVPLILGRLVFFIPGGIGVIEGSMTTLYTSLGVPYPVSVVVVLSYRALSFWFPTLIGFLLLLVLRPASGNGNRSQSA